MENKIALEKSKQIKPLEVTKVKAFLKFFANKKYEEGQEINEFFNSFINRVVLYDDKILIFYNTDTEKSTTISRKDTKKLIDTWNETDSKCLTDTKCADYYNKNETPSHKNKNPLEPQGFKRVSLGGS